MITYETMIIERDLINKLVIQFGQNVYHLDPNESSIDQINNVMAHTIEQLNLNPYEVKVAWAFFETYLEILFVDRHAATEFVSRFMISEFNKKDIH
ncbi:hypothetical protein [Paenibacillus glycanilyticus]|uniref:hypothetical protein n=1 Tax=Paenibacillus glycanilyticus TaxID=126569 RepID=UPI00190FC150|nr:hypothetical protein [Paenibacillus glycanilyticus]